MMIRRGFGGSAQGLSGYDHVEKYFVALENLNGKRRQSDEAFDKYRNHLAMFEKLVYDLEGEQQMVQHALRQYADHILADKSKRASISELLLGLNAIFDTNKLSGGTPLSQEFRMILG